jgi:hypothetical protein
MKRPVFFIQVQTRLQKGLVVFLYTVWLYISPQFTTIGAKDNGCTFCGNSVVHTRSSEGGWVWVSAYNSLHT